jgi:hypothetical protein
MARQYNKVEKRRRHSAYLERRKAINKAPAVGADAGLRKKK